MAESKTIFLTDIDHPFRWAYDCDIELADNERAIKNNLKSICFQRQKGLFLNKDIGSRTTLQVFEPNDVVTEEIITSSVTDAIVDQEPRVQIDDKIIYTRDTSGTVLKAAIFYKYKNTNSDWVSQEMDLT